MNEVSIYIKNYNLIFINIEKLNQNLSNLITDLDEEIIFEYKSNILNLVKTFKEVEKNKKLISLNINFFNSLDNKKINEELYLEIILNNFKLYSNLFNIIQNFDKFSLELNKIEIENNNRINYILKKQLIELTYNLNNNLYKLKTLNENNYIYSFIKDITIEHKENKYFLNQNIYNEISKLFYSNFQLISLIKLYYNFLINEIDDHNLNNILFKFKEDAKNKIFNINIYENNITKTKFNNKNLQLFNLIPYNKFDNDLNKIIKNLFNYTSNKKISIQNLNSILKIYSKEKKINVAIVLFYNYGNHLNFDNNKILNKNLNIDTSKGINNKIIEQNKFLICNDDYFESENKNYIHLYNYNKNTEYALFLDTYDYKNFRILTTNSLINDEFSLKNVWIKSLYVDNIIRNEPSIKIQKYNKFFEDALNKIIIDDPDTEFNEKKYFSLIDDEKTDKITRNFILSVLSELYKYYDLKYSNIKKIDDVYNVIIDEHVFDIIQKNILSNFVKLDDDLLNNELYFTYITQISEISKKIKKNIISVFFKEKNKFSKTFLLSKEDVKDFTFKILKSMLNKNFSKYENIFNEIIKKENIIKLY